MSKLRVAFLLFAFLSVKLLGAQDFIVTAKGDTIRGKVKMISAGFERRVQIINTEKEKKTFNILLVKMIFLDDVVYHPVKFGDTYRFMKLIKDGYLSLYSFQMDNQTMYDGQYLLKKDGQGLEIPNLLFKKNMMKFLGDCPEVTSQIDAGSLGRNDVLKIIDAFNLCIENNTRLSIIQQPISTSPKSIAEAWIRLEDKIKASDIAEKQDALEMVADIKNKISRGEKIPKFLTEGLRTSLSADKELSDVLLKALESIQD